MASLREQVARIECAEELFELLEVVPEPRTFAVHRLRVLRHFGAELERVESAEPPPSEAERGPLYRQALLSAVERCLRDEAGRGPVFPCLRACPSPPRGARSCAGCS